MDHRVIIPEEEFTVIEFAQNELPGVVSVNSALKYFDSRFVFPWHLSIVIQLEELANNGMPSESESKFIDFVEDAMDSAFKGKTVEKPNALFLARVTWNEIVELIWRVYDPELANAEIQSLIESKSVGRAFDYRIDPDEEWKLTDWYLNSIE